MKKIKKDKRKATDVSNNVNSVRKKVHDFKREQILEVAGRLFYERGYKSTTLDAIAEELGVTKPFIYYHFKRKQDILLELLERTLKRTNAIFDELDIEKGNPTELIKELTKRYVKEVIEMRMRVAMFWREQRELSMKDKALMHEDKQNFDGKFTKILERGIKSGEFFINDPKLTNLCISGMILWSYTWYRPDNRLTSDEIAEQVSNLALKMLKPN